MFLSSQNSVNQPNPKATKVLTENTIEPGNKLEELEKHRKHLNTSCKVNSSMSRLRIP